MNKQIALIQSTNQYRRDTLSAHKIHLASVCVWFCDLHTFGNWNRWCHRPFNYDTIWVCNERFRSIDFSPLNWCLIDSDIEIANDNNVISRALCTTKTLPTRAKRQRQNYRVWLSNFKYFGNFSILTQVRTISNVMRECFSIAKNIFNCVQDKHNRFNN